MSTTRTILVCLPAGCRAGELAEVAVEELTRLGVPVAGPVAHFSVGTRRTRRLLEPGGGVAAGGPVGLLDLDGMRRGCYAAAVRRWRLWRGVVAGTHRAQPWWIFAERHRAEPRRYPLQVAREQYLTQPRLLAMATYNALPQRAAYLPADQIEALQAGELTYAWLAWLTAVPADGLVIGEPAAGLLARTGDRLTAQLPYLREANARLDQLPRKANLIAMETT